MRMTLDLLHEFANTEVLYLFHNCMWQSRLSEIYVYSAVPREQTGWLSTHKSLRACLICAYVFVSVFVINWTFNRHWHTIIDKSSCSCNGAFADNWEVCVDFLSTRTGRLFCRNKSPYSNRGICRLWWFGFVGSFRNVEQLVTPIPASNCP